MPAITAPDAYERAVDRFLADSAYGERWARIWLDLARYADSAGYGSDPLRPTIWRYRDWVIDAFNRNLPYDQFTIEQIAGDLLPEPDAATQRIATAFHRNTMTNTEGGTDDEEFRVAAVKDRVDTTMQVWMGLTIGCAKCHSHKYDPITQDEYYRFYAFFNQTADADRPDESPVIPAPTPALEEKIRRIDDRLAALRKTARHHDPRAGRGAGEVGSRAGNASRVGRARTRFGPLRRGRQALETLPDGSLQGERAEPRAAIPTPSSPGPVWPRSARSGSRPSPTRPCPPTGTGRGAAGQFVLSRFGAEVAVRHRGKGPGRAVRAGRASRARRRSSRWPRSRSSAKARTSPCGGAAEQSSTDYAGAAARAIDGKTDGRYSLANSTTHTQAEDNPWWEVRLAEPAAIERINVWNRTDKGVEDRLARFRVQVLDDDRKVVWQTDVAEPPKPQRELATAGPRAPGTFARAPGRLCAAGLRHRRHHRPARRARRSRAGRFRPGRRSGTRPCSCSSQPLAVPSPARLTFRLEHRSKVPGAQSRPVPAWRSPRDPAAARWADVPSAVLAVLATPAAERTAEQRAALDRHYRSIAPS